LLALLGAVGGLYLVGRRERAEKRRPSFAAIDDPAVTAAWLRIASLPHLRCLQGIFAERAVAGRAEVRVLDVGCGAGELARRMAALPQVKSVTGIDLSTELIDTARSIADDRELPTHFLLADAGEMPFADGEFDVVVSTLSLHHWEDPIAVLREIKRVLAPGGVAMIADIRRDAPTLFIGMVAMATRYLAPPAVRKTGEPLASLQAAYTPCEAVLLAAKAGWHDPTVSTGPAWLILTGYAERASAP